MPSVQRFLSGHNNLARTAVLAASSVRPSTAIERVAAQRAGGGRVRLAGAYTGHEAAQVDVEIVAAGGIPRASVPQFVGVGNGQLAVEAVDAGAALQELTLTLVDLGIATEYAGLDAREVRIRARAPGAVGNAIRITVQPQLVRVLTDWALLADWSAGTVVQTGGQWDFGGLPLSAKGELDPASPRIQFGFDPQVYRPWRQYRDGAWQFGLSPALERSQPKGAAVYAVTGGYLITVTDGVTTETFGDVGASQPEIVTFYELLEALQASALVEVAGVVAVDRAMGGQAAIDVPLRTSAWLLAMGGKVQLQGVAVPAAAPTQSVVVRCINADAIGRERWSVVGDVSGVLAAATTGVPYTSAAALFTVPALDPAAVGGGEWSFKYEPVARDSGVGVPSVCVRPFRFGRNAIARTVTFRYQRRPPADCKCSDMPTPRVSLQCLGVSTGADMALDAAYQSRLQALYEWRQGFLDSNLSIVESPHGFGYVRTDAREIEVANGVTASLAGALAEVYESATALVQWDVEFARAVAFMAPMAGMSNAAQGARVAVPWSAAAAPTFGSFFRPTVPNGRLYRVAIDYTTGATEPDWTLPTPMDNGHALEAFEYWRPGAAVELGRSAEPGNGFRYIVTTAGVSAAVEPSWAAASVADGTAVWSRVSGAAMELHVAEDVSIEWVTLDINSGAAGVVLRRRGGTVTIHPYNAPEQVAAGVTAVMASAAEVAKMIDARMDRVRAVAGIVPKSDSSSADAGGCWIDHGDAFWWADVDGFYLPAFTNRAYVSARRNTDTGVAYSTMEFGFGLVVACPDRLKEGDSLTIRISQVDGAKPYQVGDEAVLQTVAAGPAWLTGGVDGTDVQTWRSVGGIDGVLPDYVVPTDGGAVPVYSAAGVDLRLAPGGIPFVLGDAFSLAVEAGQYRWRRDGGVWAALADIPPGGAGVLADGLAVHFDAGAAPSFVPGDAYAFEVHQPWAVGHVRDALASTWGWAGDGATLLIDLGSAQELGAVALARYELPTGATVAVEFSQDAVAWSLPLPLDVARAVSVVFIELMLQARYLRVTVADAPGGSIGWIWAGMPVATDHHASTCQRRRRWAVGRGDGLNPASLYAGAGDGWSLGWAPGDAGGSRLLDSDVQQLLGLIDWAQEAGEPLLFVPHHLHPQDATLVRIGGDALDVSDIHEYQPDAAGHRMLSATLELEPVFA